MRLFHLLVVHVAGAPDERGPAFRVKLQGSDAVAPVSLSRDLRGQDLKAVPWWKTWRDSAEWTLSCCVCLFLLHLLPPLTFSVRVDLAWVAAVARCSSWPWRGGSPVWIVTTCSISHICFVFAICNFKDNGDENLSWVVSCVLAACGSCQLPATEWGPGRAEWAGSLMTSRWASLSSQVSGASSSGSACGRISCEGSRPLWTCMFAIHRKHNSSILTEYLPRLSNLKV